MRIIGREGAITYQRQYIYVVSGKEYTLNSFEANSKPYKTIKYNPNNPNEARTYEGINLETIIGFCIGLIFLFSPFISKFLHTKNNLKMNKIKYRVLRISKRNITKIVTACFFGYMAISLIFVLQEVFLEPNWSQVVIQYSGFEIIIECAIFIIGRFSFGKSTSHFNIFRN